VKLFGHNFLRSDFHSKTPVCSTANYEQQNTLANIPKYVQGIGMSWQKPTDAEGKNWTTIVGPSDLPYPPGMSPPWAAVNGASVRAYNASPNMSGTQGLTLAHNRGVTGILDPDPSTPGSVTVLRAGVYRIALHATDLVVNVDISTSTCDAVVMVAVNTVENKALTIRNYYGQNSAEASTVISAGSYAEVELAVDDVITVFTSGTYGSSLARFDLTVSGPFIE